MARSRSSRHDGVPDWKTYLTLQVLDAAALALGPLRAGEIRIPGRVSSRREGDETALEAVRGVDGPAAGEALGQKYVEKYFLPEAKARMLEMVRNLQPR